MWEFFINLENAWPESHMWEKHIEVCLTGYHARSCGTLEMLANDSSHFSILAQINVTYGRRSHSSSTTAKTKPIEHWGDHELQGRYMRSTLTEYGSDWDGSKTGWNGTTTFLRYKLYICKLLGFRDMSRGHGEAI